MSSKQHWLFQVIEFNLDEGNLLIGATEGSGDVGLGQFGEVSLGSLRFPHASVLLFELLQLTSSSRTSLLCCTDSLELVV